MRNSSLNVYSNLKTLKHENETILHFPNCYSKIVVFVNFRKSARFLGSQKGHIRWHFGQPRLGILSLKS